MPWEEGAVRLVLERALGYPYPRLESSYLYDSGRVLPLRAERTGAGLLLRVGEKRLSPESLDWEQRIPVLAYGSNASPEQLRRKFPQGTIPVLRGRVKDYDVVFAALIASYGSVPATLFPSPGTVVEVWLTLLTPEQKAVMDRSERLGVAYTLGSVSAWSSWPQESLGEWSRPLAYWAQKGALAPKGSPIALAEVPAEGRRFVSLTQREALDVVRRLIAPDLPLETFILRLVRERAFRRSVQERLPRRLQELDRSALPEHVEEERRSDQRC